MKSSKQFLNLKKILDKPKILAEKANLVYIGDQYLTIERKRKGKHFTYQKKNKPIKNKQDLQRIEKLVIPPAWEQVRISEIPEGHLQAIGRDSKHRKQYKYHDHWSHIRNQTKFYRMIAFGRVLPKIRIQLNYDLSKPGWPKEKIAALIISLMEETHIRIGNQQYARRNKTYGLTTLRKKHVSLSQEKIKFEFTGKKGKKHRITLRNKKLVQLVNRCEEIPGWELFQYYDEYGEKQTADSSMVNEYIHRCVGDYFSAKDFRTWAASIIFFEELYDAPTTTIEKIRDKNILNAYDVTAKQLGNTRNVCKKYYVHPYIVSAYKSGIIKQHFETLSKCVENSNHNFTCAEQQLLTLLEHYKPKFMLKA